MDQKILINELPGRFGTGTRHLIHRISFEERSLTVANAISTNCERHTAFVSIKRGDVAQGNLDAFRASFPKAKIVALDTTNPLQTADALFTSIVEITKYSGLRDTVIDVTSFRREELLMILAIVRSANVPQDTNCALVYVSAAKMADWMSGQVTGCHSVIGYAGEIWPSRSTRLVILMGFEFNRARSIIESYEPKSLIIGKGSRAESISIELAEKNDLFFRELRSQYDNVEGTFEFSAKSPTKVADEIEAAVKLDYDSNVIIAPLHTKLSTIGAGLYAQRHKEVQICYASVNSYNEQAYSTPGNDAYVLQLSELL